MPTPKHPPQWETPFLAELARTGNVTASAEVAGVDRTNAQARRKRAPAFAAAWDSALAEFRAARSFHMGLSAGKDEARVHASGAKMMRVGAGRWSKAAEERFLVELGTSGKVRRAAAAAGFSEETIYRRRRKQRAFADAWDMAVENGKARVDALLVSWAERAFDPDAMPMPEEGAVPTITVDQAIKIAQPRGGRAGGRTGSGRTSGKKHADPFFDGWEEDHQEYLDARDRIAERLQRLAKSDDEEKAAAGWTRCALHEVWVPPGWVRVAPSAES